MSDQAELEAVFRARRSHAFATRRFWFAFASPDSIWSSGCGISARGREDAEWMLEAFLIGHRKRPTVEFVIEDVDHETLDPAIVRMTGDTAIRGIWYPRRNTGFARQLLPLLETHISSFESVALAAIAAEARQNIAALDRKRGKTAAEKRSVSDTWNVEDWMMSLIPGEEAHKEGEAAVARFSVDGDHERLTRSLEKIVTWLKRPTGPEDRAAPGQKSPLVDLLLPMIANNLAGPAANALAADIVAADARATLWARDRRRDDKLSAEGWTQLLEFAEDATVRCRKAIREFGASGDKDSLMEALTHALGILDRRPPVAEGRTSVPERAIASCLAALAGNDVADPQVGKLARRAIKEEFEADLWAVERRLDGRLDPEGWSLFRSWTDEAIAECQAALQRHAGNGDSEALASSLLRVIELLKRRPPHDRLDA